MACGTLKGLGTWLVIITYNSKGYLKLLINILLYSYSTCHGGEPKSRELINAKTTMMSWKTILCMAFPYQLHTIILCQI